MNFEYNHLLPADFDANSRVWIYQASRLFTISEALQIEDILNDLVQHWNAHGAPVKGYANLFFGQFIILMADETATGVSGCSIDSSVRIIQQIEKQFGVEMFNWQNLAFVVKDKVQIIPRQQFNYALENNFISPDTLFFNNVVATKKELEENWIIPVKNSWLKTKIKATVQ
ncbi:hypothetical protein [Parafilimonas terrae]|jgi:hypothetical protein|uniref:ABC transporter ATPase n=1 Tax=Parafilimonas terrae TaxID=1465490 RepID=A0A1I5S1Y0_9BACT|nr:hypothetical protein [Parafilimonas terrae]SFP64571.1 hypothetical protein SAMN05444277_101533 [Parafilimonas terrae]